MVWNSQDILFAALGGGLIGLAASLMLFFNGRVTGISGIYNGVFNKLSADFYWRLALVLGLVAGGAVVYVLNPNMVVSDSGRTQWDLVIAGVLVGFGTVMGSGCTSGHGVCGLSRLSVRSLVATGTFMLFGVIGATIYRMIFLSGL